MDWRQRRYRPSTDKSRFLCPELSALADIHRVAHSMNYLTSFCRYLASQDPDHLTEKGEFFGRLSLLLQIKSQLSTQQQLLEAAKHLLPASTASDTRVTTQTNVLQSLGTPPALLLQKLTV